MKQPTPRAVLTCQYVHYCERQREIWPAEVHLSDYGVILQGAGPEWVRLREQLIDAAAGSGRTVWQVVTEAVRRYVDVDGEGEANPGAEGVNDLGRPQNVSSRGLERDPGEYQRCAVAALERILARRTGKAGGGWDGTLFSKHPGP